MSEHCCLQCDSPQQHFGWAIIININVFRGAPNLLIFFNVHVNRFKFLWIHTYSCEYTSEIYIKINKFEHYIFNDGPNH
jgi:hypothetical protein